MNRFASRRTVLRGAGVALALPWLSSLAGGSALAQAAPKRLRFLPIFLPNGAPELWKPLASGRGNEWQLSSILEPLKALKTQVTVISGLENGSVFNADGSPSVEPAHSRQTGAWLTCRDADQERKQLGVDDANGVSADQVLSQKLGVSSLQVGLSTARSSCDGRPCSLSRSVSWSTPTTPLGKVVDPGQLFRMLTGAAPDEPLPAQSGSRAARKSVLDAVASSAGVVRQRLSQQDRQRLDEYLEAVRETEVRLSSSQPNACEPPASPTLPMISDDAFRRDSDVYDKGRHADAMNDLVAWALHCDAARVVSYMLEDARSEYEYSKVPVRHFTSTGSTLLDRFCTSYHSAQTGAEDDYCSITHFNVGKVAALCAKLSSLPDGDGASVLDNTVIMLGAAMHGSLQYCNDLPTLLIGGGGGKLRTDQHVVLNNRPMRDLYITLLNGIFEANVGDFGVNATGAPLSMIEELLA